MDIKQTLESWIPLAGMCVADPVKICIWETG
jgi:hypothetical protein